MAPNRKNSAANNGWSHNQWTAPLSSIASIFMTTTQFRIRKTKNLSIWSENRYTTRLKQGLDPLSRCLTMKGQHRCSSECSVGGFKSRLQTLLLKNYWEVETELNILMRVTSYFIQTAKKWPFILVCMNWMYLWIFLDIWLVP